MTARTIRLVHKAGGRQTFAPGMSNRPLMMPNETALTDPFLFLMEDWMQEPGGFPDHPHRGIETVTFVLDGELMHADNRGNQGTLVMDDVQWMTAGSGIIHAELPSEHSYSHTLQLWLNLPAAKKMVESNYQDLLGVESTPLEDGRASIRLLSGELDGVKAPTHTQTSVQYLDVRLDADGHTTLPIPAAHNGFVAMLEGSARFGPDGIVGNAPDMLWLDFPHVTAGESTLQVRSTVPARFLVVTGTPLREPVVAYGPFVMNTREEIAQAYRDFHAGLFGGPTPAALAHQR